MSLAEPVPNTGTRLRLYGIARAENVEHLGMDHIAFAGLRIGTIKSGGIVALVREIEAHPAWQLWRRRDGAGTLMPVWSALSAFIPFLPAQPGAEFDSAANLEEMLRARGAELEELVRAHSGFVEFGITARFDEARSYDELLLGPLSRLRAQADHEQWLIERTLAQSVAGRHAAFAARLRRAIGEIAADVVEVPRPDSAMCARVLVSRQARARFRERIASLKGEAEAGAALSVTPSLPPFNFRRVELSTPEPGAVMRACEALGIGDASARAGIRAAYRRALERCYPRAANQAEASVHSHLQSQFSLLEQVAEGQVRSARGEAREVIRFDAEALRSTWLLRLHTGRFKARAA